MLFFKVIYAYHEFVLLCTEKSYSHTACYYSEVSIKRKSPFVIFLEQMMNIIRYGDINRYYFLYGFDLYGFRDKNEYVDYKEFRDRREYLNRLNPNVPIAILRDKFLFGIVAESLNIPTPSNIGIIEKGNIYIIKEKRNFPFCNFILDNKIDAFLKLIDGECADSVYAIKVTDGTIILNGEYKTYDELKILLGNGKFLLQERITQHEVLNHLYPNAINTIRLETVVNRKDGKIVTLPLLMRIGTGTSNVDNWAAGGLAVGINVEPNGGGRMSKFAFYKPMYGTKVSVHPDTGIVFDGYELPYIGEAIDLAKAFHSHFKNIHSIGWDIAITENGPCFIEGNDNWEISLVQACSKGLRKEFQEFFSDIK